ncbi:hypothetical protein [Dysgonomonas reticulitermitis]
MSIKISLNDFFKDYQNDGNLLSFEERIEEIEKSADYPIELEQTITINNREELVSAIKEQLKLDALILSEKKKFEELIKNSNGEDKSEVIKEAIHEFIEQQTGIFALEKYKMKYIEEQFMEYL